MKTPSEYAEIAFCRSSDLAKSRTALKRVATGVRTVIAAKSTHGLTEDEQRLLSEAASLLEAMTARVTSAAKLAKGREEAFEVRRRHAEQLVKMRLGHLTSIRDLVPIIDGTHNMHWLEGSMDAQKLARNLATAKQAAFADIAYRIAAGGRELGQHLEEVCSRLQEIRNGVEAKHATLIETLEKQSS